VRAGEELAWAGEIESGFVTDVQRLLDEQLAGPSDSVRTLIVHDASGTIVATSADATATMGLVHTDLVGRSSWNPLGTAVSEQGTPLPDEQCPALRTLATGEPISDFVVGVLVSETDMAGHTRWLSLSSHPVGVPLAGVVVVATDISDTPRGRDATDNLLATYRLLGRPTSDLILHVDLNGAVLWASDSAAWILGDSPDRLSGQHIVTRVHPDDVPAVAELLAAIRDHAEPARLECRWRVSDGRFHWMATQARPISSESGDLFGAIIGLQDIDKYVLDRQKFAEAQQQYRLLAENATDAVMLMD